MLQEGKNSKVHLPLKKLESKDTASKLDVGDMFFLTYSGHGGQVKDVDGDEDDGKDETWCQFLDDEMDILWSHFKPGTRLLILSDSCHSGTVTKDPAVKKDDSGGDTPRIMPRAEGLDRFRRNRDR